MCTSTAIKAAKRDDLRRTAESLALPLRLHQALQPPINYFHDSILPFHVLYIWKLIASA
jgi:hypothetical protein